MSVIRMKYRSQQGTITGPLTPHFHCHLDRLGRGYLLHQTHNFHHRQLV